MGATPTAWAADTGAGAARVSATSAHAELTGRHAETLRPLPRPAQRQPPRARRPLPGDQEAHQEGDQGNPGRLTRRDQPPTTADLVSGEVPTPAGLNHKLRSLPLIIINPLPTGPTAETGSGTELRHGPGGVVASWSGEQCW